jgi:hypothetical protein
MNGIRGCTEMDKKYKLFLDSPSEKKERNQDDLFLFMKNCNYPAYCRKSTITYAL